MALPLSSLWAIRTNYIKSQKKEHPTKAFVAKMQTRYGGLNPFWLILLIMVISEKLSVFLNTNQAHKCIPTEMLLISLEWAILYLLSIFQFLRYLDHLLHKFPCPNITVKKEVTKIAIISSIFILFSTIALTVTL